MFHCFVCNLSYEDVPTLMSHFKLQHRFSLHNRFICKQGKCIREFQSIYAFRQHLLKKHHGLVALDERELNLSIENDSALCSSSQIKQTTTTNVVDKPQDFPPSVIPKPSINDLPSRLKISAVSFVSDLYGQSSLTRRHIQIVIDMIGEFISSTVIQDLQLIVMSKLQKLNLEDREKAEIERAFTICATPFKDLQTDYRRLQYFKETGCYIEPTPYVMGETLESKAIRGTFTITPVNVFGQFISIKSVLKKLFTMPSLLQTIIDYIDSLSLKSSLITNIVQAELFLKVQSRFCGRKILPLVVYFDELETNNPLGGKTGRHKLGAVYFSLACIPPEFQSLLENIFLTLLFCNKDRVEFGNKATFQPLLNDLKDMEQDPICTWNGVDIYVCCIAIVGDNLGVHEMCGFVESFSANYPCRFCKVSRDTLKSQTIEDINLLRTVANYNTDLDVDDVSKTGISEDCMFNELVSFHAVENLACDIMHDILEGTCQYDLAQIISHFVVDLKLFTLDQLNKKIGGFDFGSENNKNRPPFLRKEKLKISRLGMSASQTITFVRYLGLIIGDLIPENNSYWNLYICLRQIFEILMSRSCTLQDSIYLETLIKEHHEVYIKLFGKTLKPKMHFMVHYPRLMRSLGPLCNIWCMRFEGKHKPLKIAAHITTSRVNLPYTLSVKHQLQLCRRFINNIGLQSKPSIGCDISRNIESHHFFSKFGKLLFDSDRSVSWIKIKGSTYKPKMVLNIGFEDYLPVFATIILVCLDDNQDLSFIVRLLKTISGDSHFQAYVVESTDVWLRQPYSSLPNYITSWVHNHASGESFVILN